jgi:tRNA (cytidine32/uridine32-2'-O)-methyltransferase
MASVSDLPVPTEEPIWYPNGSEMEYFYKHMEEALDQRGFIPQDKRESTMQKLRRVFGRARPEMGELKLLHSMIRLIKR